MDDPERAEFIGAIVQLARPFNRIWGSPRDCSACPTTRVGFSAQELIDARAQVGPCGVNTWMRSLSVVRASRCTRQIGRSES
jgi:hypothetical protein